MDRTLVDKFGPWARAMLPDEALEQDRANRAVVRRDATVNPEALASSISVPIYLDIAGALSIGNDIGPRRRVPQAITIWQVRVDARTGPTSPNSSTLHVAADGVRIASVSIAAGLTSGVSSVSVDVDAGALLTIDCSAANGAANASIAIATRPRGR